MSESTGTPAAPPTPAATPSDSGVSPPANEQPSISISEAARLLNRQRRGPEAPAAPATPESTRKPPAELAAASKAAPAEAPKPEPSPLSAMERALGVPGAAAVAPADMALGDGFEIEGRQLKTL